MDWKIDTLNKLIKIEKENGNHSGTITMNYIHYLEKMIRMIKYGKSIGGNK